MNLDCLDRLGELGYGLTMEEKAGFQMAAVQRELEENLPNPLRFWGRVMGAENDYLVGSCLVPVANEFPGKVFFYCTTSDYTLRQLPELSEEFEKLAGDQGGRFSGDPSTLLSGEEEEDAPPPEEDGEETKEVEKFREVHRLSYAVRQIDHDAAVTTRGEFMVTGTHQVVPNTQFCGNSFDTAGLLDAYYHFRMPHSSLALAALKKQGIVRPGEFLDPLTDDKPEGLWSVDRNASNSVVYVRNFYWPGYVFYSVVNSPECGGAYFGDGLANPDLAFML